MTRDQEYLPLKPNDEATHLKVQLYYSLGGMNFATYQNEARGYYLSVGPVTRSKTSGMTMESFTAFSGVKRLVLPVARQSPKRLEQARREAEAIRNRLIDHVLAEHHFELAEQMS